MEDQKPVDDDPAMRYETSADDDGARDSQDPAPPCPSDDRTLEEAGYGYGV